MRASPSVPQCRPAGCVPQVELTCQQLEGFSSQSALPSSEVASGQLGEAAEAVSDTVGTAVGRTIHDDTAGHLLEGSERGDLGLEVGLAGWSAVGGSATSSGRARGELRGWSLNPYFPDGLVVSAWRLRISLQNPAFPSTSC
jgi:hypothetical protein